MEDTLKRRFNLHKSPSKKALSHATSGNRKANQSANPIPERNIRKAITSSNKPFVDSSPLNASVAPKSPSTSSSSSSFRSVYFYSSLSFLHNDRSVSSLTERAYSDVIFVSGSPNLLRRHPPALLPTLILLPLLLNQSLPLLVLHPKALLQNLPRISLQLPFISNNFVKEFFTRNNKLHRVILSNKPQISQKIGNILAETHIQNYIKQV